MKSRRISVSWCTYRSWLSNPEGRYLVHGFRKSRDGSYRYSRYWLWKEDTEAQRIEMWRDLESQGFCDEDEVPGGKAPSESLMRDLWDGDYLQWAETKEEALKEVVRDLMEEGRYPG